MREREAARREHREYVAGECPELWPENQRAWEMFEKVKSQLILAPMGGVVGVMYSAVEWLFKLWQVPEEDAKEEFDRIWLLERIWVAALVARAEGARGGGQKAADPARS